MEIKVFIDAFDVNSTSRYKELEQKLKNLESRKRAKSGYDLSDHKEEKILQEEEPIEQPSEANNQSLHGWINLIINLKKNVKIGSTC